MDLQLQELLRLHEELKELRSQIRRPKASTCFLSELKSIAKAHLERTSDIVETIERISDGLQQISQRPSELNNKVYIGRNSTPQLITLKQSATDLFSEVKINEHDLNINEEIDLFPVNECMEDLRATEVKAREFINMYKEVKCNIDRTAKSNEVISDVVEPKIVTDSLDGTIETIASEDVVASSPILMI